MNSLKALKVTSVLTHPQMFCLTCFAAFRGKERLFWPDFIALTLKNQEIILRALVIAYLGRTNNQQRGSANPDVPALLFQFHHTHTRVHTHTTHTLGCLENLVPILRTLPLPNSLALGFAKSFLSISAVHCSEMARCLRKG